MDTKTFKIGFTAILFLAAVLALAVFSHFSRLNSSGSSVFQPNLEVQPPKKSDLEAQLPNEVKMLFLGDMMFDRYIRQVGERKGYDYIFKEVDNLLSGNDLVVANLEGPITDNKSVSVGTEFGEKENYFLTFDPKIAKVLANHNIKLLDIGNNHILNFKSSGVSETQKYLAENNISYFGNPLEKENYLIKDFEGFKIGFVSYNQFEPDAVAKALNNIANARKRANVVILYAHWGKEYDDSVLPSIRALAHNFIDNGADLIIGSHPHVVQEKEVYKGKTIFYSLGNFVFDQYFNPRTTKGLAVEVSINPVTENYAV